ncbi:hypothetical protein OH77DRAFT_1022906 [Trametes cingulata]|nr:hypothetical protein OH77DRAFT_1022906 [Trametes cingulata]
MQIGSSDWREDSLSARVALRAIFGWFDYLVEESSIPFLKDHIRPWDVHFVAVCEYGASWRFSSALLMSYLRHLLPLPVAWGVRQRLSTLFSQPLSGDGLGDVLSLTRKLMVLHTRIFTDPDASEEYRTSLSAWTGEAVREVGDALEKVDCSNITIWNLCRLSEFLEELVKEHTLAKPSVRSDFVIGLQNVLDTVKSRPDLDNVSQECIRRCEVVLKRLESMLQSDIPAPVATESHSYAAAELASTPRAGPSGSHSVHEQEKQVLAPANSSDAVEPANLVATSSPVSAPVDTSTLPAAASASVSLIPPLEPVQEQAERILDSTDPSDAVEPAKTEPNSSSGSPINSCSDPASASQSPPSEPAQEQPEISPDAANLSHPDDPRPAPTSPSSGPPLNAPLASPASRSDTGSLPPASSLVQEEQKSSMPAQAGDGADTVSPATPDRCHAEPASSTLSGVLLPSPGPAGSASASQTPPWHPLQDEADGCAPTRSDPSEPCDDPARGSASARPSSPPA